MLGEEEEVGQYDLEREAPPIEHDEYDEDDYLSEEVNRPRRIRRKPAWLDDYVSCIFRSEMLPIKVTPRKPQTPGLMCPVCKEGVINHQAFSENVLQCASVRYSCKTCGVTLKKLAYLKQHEKRQHNSGG